ncbi:hypothetical protein [Streptomyces sp. AS02]|uniref:hypothetical protein n=1 Tax=Streptomyces sp. AS02 TaxID=2938946 RepID=UPI0020213569|nr:hypothetical protein [Streptomyces sp. AS02]MCL8011693.1 hypothetical protein [Streptomyces sp. AS02]
MTWSAALPVAALRVLRTAAGRRALRVALVVGGLFALGLLCGERAYAADGVPVGSGTASTPSVSVPSASSVTAPAASVGALPSAPKDEETAPAPALPESPRPLAPNTPAPNTPAPAAPHPTDTDTDTDTDTGTGTDTEDADPAPAPDATDDQVLRPVTHGLLPGVGDRVVNPVVKPVVDVVESVTEGLAEAPPLSALPTLPALPSLPTVPESPTWPSWPGFEVPGLPSFPTLPNHPGVPAQTLPAPFTPTPQPGPAVPASGDASDGEGRTATAAPVAYGPRYVADAAAPGVPAPTGAHRAAPSVGAPAQQAPVDHPGGVGGSRSAGDNSTPRHGDAHAVSLNQRAPLRLVPGAAARADVDEIQDRHGDIPVSPA